MPGADAVIIDLVDLRDTRPPKSYPNQVWIAFGVEQPHSKHSPLAASNQRRHDVFNWTMTYRLDSDVPLPYGLLKSLADVPNRNLTEIALRKSKSTARMVSNWRTPSKRELYVSMLKEYYSVDVYGGCGSFKISRNKDSEFMTLLDNTERKYRVVPLPAVLASGENHGKIRIEDCSIKLFWTNKKMNPTVSLQIFPCKDIPNFRMRRYLVVVTALVFIGGYLLVPFNYFLQPRNLYLTLQLNHIAENPASKKPTTKYSLVDELNKSLYYHVPITSTHHFRNLTSNQSHDLTTEPDVKTKLILFYNRPSWWPRDISKFGTDECSLESCICSDEGKRLAEADAVIIDLVELRDPRPPKRYPNQVWISFGLEAPPYYETPNHAYEQWRHDVFNWTMTYRVDSDVVLPYNVLLRLEDVPNRNFTEISLRKSKSAAWMVSNCRTPSKRELYVTMLKEFYSVDVYGGCGSFKINRNKDSEFMTLLDNTYRFYLSFENSLCKDYITEKLFKTFDIDIVAVVRGGANYSAMIPAGTYINTADYSSPRKLADYLLYLERNVTAYSEILRRKSQYVIANRAGKWPRWKAAYCDICTRLHHINTYTKVYKDTVTWLRNGICHQPRDLL